MIILGPPASGKTGLALRLAAELSRPVLCKDDVKEALFDVLGSTDREGSRRFSEAALAAVLRMARTQLCAGSCCLIEGNFTRNHAAALREILGASQASAAQILCSAPLPELERRFAARVRHPGQLDDVGGAFDFRLERADFDEVERILAEEIHDPVGPEFMAPPETAGA